MNEASGVTMAQQIQSGIRTPEEMLGYAFESIERLDTEIGAFVSVLDREHAVVQATQASHARRPLAGLPVAVKDIFDTVDLPTSYGSTIYTGFRPQTDAAMVSLLKRAGATVVGKTVTCEFAYMAPTSTRNPADLQRTAGGSSSGSAAAVAAGMVPFAIGTQTGGSTIRPASYCGIAGYKPSFGMFPTSGMKCFSWSLDTIGLFAATVNDVAWFAETLIGRPLMTELKSALKSDPEDLRALVVGVPLAYPWEQPSSNANRAMEKACKAIEASGGKLKQVALPKWLGTLYYAHATLQEYEASQSLAFEFDQHREQLSPMLTEFLLRAQRVSALQYDVTRQLIADARLQLDQLFAGIDVLLTPSAPDEAPLGFLSTGEPSFNKVWTLLGTPCVSVPGLFGNNGCPVGVQVIAPPWHDHQCLAAASMVEAAIAEGFEVFS